MSLLSTLGKIGHALKVGVNDVAPFATVAASFVPGGNLVAHTVLNAMATAEQLLNSTGDGPVRKDIVLKVVNQIHPGLDQTQLGNSIDGIVSAFKMVEDAINKIPEVKPVVH